MQKSLRIKVYASLDPLNVTNMNFQSFHHLPKMWLSSIEIPKIKFLQFWGSRIPKNLILRLFLRPLTSIKHPKNHIFAKYQTISSP